MELGVGSFFLKIIYFNNLLDKKNQHNHLKGLVTFVLTV